MKFDMHCKISHISVTIIGIFLTMYYFFLAYDWDNIESASIENVDTSLTNHKKIKLNCFV